MPAATKKSKEKRSQERLARYEEKIRRGEASTDPKQIRKRARRYERMARDALSILYKPVEEWDDEELARGRPRNPDGSFRGKPPEWVSREVHEEAIKRFVDYAQAETRAVVPDAIALVKNLLLTDEQDKRGRPLVPAGVQLDAAKWLIEHVIGKPTQRKEVDINVRLSGLLGNVMVNPEDLVGAAGGAQGLADGAIEVSSRQLPSSTGQAVPVRYVPSMVRTEMGAYVDAEDDEDE